MANSMTSKDNDNRLNPSAFQKSLDEDNRDKYSVELK